MFSCVRMQAVVSTSQRDLWTSSDTCQDAPTAVRLGGTAHSERRFEETDRPPESVVTGTVQVGASSGSSAGMMETTRETSVQQTGGDEMVDDQPSRELPAESQGGPATGNVREDAMVAMLLENLSVRDCTVGRGGGEERR